jgi:hypothetical protein
MRRHGFTFGTLPCIALVATLFPGQASAGFLMRDMPLERPATTLRYLRPSLDAQDLRGASGSYDAILSRPVGKTASVLLDLGVDFAQGGPLPYTGPIFVPAYGGYHHTYAAASTQQSVSCLGVGVQMHTGAPERRTCTTLTVTFPMTGDSDALAYQVGLFSNYYNSQRAPGKNIRLGMDVTHERRSSRGAWGVEFGGQMFVSTQGYDPLPGSLHWSAGGEARLGGATIRAEYLDAVDFDNHYEHTWQRLTHIVALGARADLGAARPGFFVQVPIDAQFDQVIDAVYGVELRFVLSPLGN